jgi:N-methylhydantoinase A/oxoprolinase/acetone carboxylase beta subunit
LVNMGVIARISVTPTDILHVNGAYNQWNREAAIKGVDILASRIGVGRDEFVELAAERIVNELCYTCLQSMVSYEGQNIWLKDNPTVMYMINKALSPAEDQKFDCSYSLNMPIIGIGAPIAAWLPQVAEKLNTDLIIPEHAEVANAVGVAAGKIMETVKVLIKPGEKDGTYLMHAPWERKYFEDLQAYGPLRFQQYL